MTTAWGKPPGQVPVGEGRLASVFLGPRRSESSCRYRRRVKAEIRQGTFLRNLASALLIGSAAVFAAWAEPRAESRAPLEITVDYWRECGRLAGQVVHILQVNGTQAEFEAKASSYWNASGLMLEKGVTYRVEVTDRNPTWYDADQEADASGWRREPEGLLYWFVALTRRLVRAPDRKLFYLIGVIYGRCEDGRVCARQFPIGPSTEFAAPADGEFCSFANDIPFMYWNNSGSMTIRITRIGR